MYGRNRITKERKKNLSQNADDGYGKRDYILTNCETCASSHFVRSALAFNTCDTFEV
jgi:hypothetical protein